MVVDHIVPLVAGGNSTLDNLCLACYRCNEFKGPRTTVITAETQTALFHPRHQIWHEHFQWSDDGLSIIPQTLCGQATADLLHLNDEWLQRARRIWMLAGIHPPLE